MGNELKGSELKGSELALAMLKRGDKKVWCAVSDDSDDEAMTASDCDSFTAHIIGFKDGYFYCIGGMQWLCAVPIKISEVIEDERRKYGVAC